MNAHHKNDQQAHQSKPAEEPPSVEPYRHVSELIRHKLHITSDEQALVAANAAQESLGTTSILAAVHMFAFYTPLDQGGLGLILGTTAGLATLGVISFATLLITIPLSIMAYKKYMNEALSLIKTINDEEATRKKHRNELFLNLLALRCLFAENEAEFNRHIETIELGNEEVDATKLISYVNSLHSMQEFKHYQLQKNEIAEKKEYALINRYTLPQIITHPVLSRDDNVRQQILYNLPQLNHQHEKKWDECFKAIPTLPIVNRREAILEGFGKFLSMAGALLGVTTTFAGICITAGFSIALSATGWGFLVVTILAGCILFGIATGIAEQKNLQREELQSRIQQRNNTLITTNQRMQAALTHKQLMITEHQPAITSEIKQMPANVIPLQKQLIEENQSTMTPEIKQLSTNLSDLQKQLAEEKQARLLAEKQLSSEKEARLQAEQQLHKLQEEKSNPQLKIVTANSPRLFGTSSKSAISPTVTLSTTSMPSLKNNAHSG